VQEVAERCGLHPNTARFHLDALVAAGLASRDRGPRQNPASGHTGHPGRPGRPAIGYRAADGEGSGAPTGERRYRLLAEMLASMIAGLLPHPATTAEQAGREWGGYLTEQPPPYRPPTAARALDDLTALLADMGFDPEVAALGTRPRMLLRECPFREVASRHQAVVCSLHLGVIRGALSRMRAPLTVGRLEPFAGPGLCLVHLKHLGEDGAGEQDGQGVAGAAAAGR
jgi:predicted ArsR family transcriptional regulator